MLNKTKQTKRAAAFLAVVVAVSIGTDATGGDGGVVLISDGRSTSALSIVPQCDSQSFMNVTDAPQSFQSFLSSIDANQECDVASALAAATQESHVTATAMSAFGTALGSVSSDVMGVIHAIPRSQFDVTFEILQPREWTVAGSLMTAGDHGPPVVAAHSLVKLWQPGGDTIYEHVHTTQTPGFFDIDETIMLEPGVYRFLADAFVLIDGGVPPSAFAAAVFSLDIDITPPAVVGDLNGDGVVDVSDLLILLAAWGPCSRSGDCPADLNGDGTVNVSDLLLLLANWG